MKFFHTADWHLGKLVQGVYMTEDQRHILEQFAAAIEEQRPDCVIIAGDLYDRAVPPTEAVNLLDETLAKIVLELDTPVFAVAGNHDSPGRLNFGSRFFQKNRIHISGHVKKEHEPVVLHDEFGEVHFHLLPYADPSHVRYTLENEEIRSHNDAAQALTERIAGKLEPGARHIAIGHAFVTPHGEQQDNTSDSERPLSIGGAEHVDARHFEPFHYTALGHLHQAHHVLNETIRYAGSPLKYSISEEHHKKGFLIVEMDGEGHVSVEKRLLEPKRDMRTVEGFMQDILQHEPNEDFVFVKLLDETPILYPMEKIRSVYPNAMHVERKTISGAGMQNAQGSRREMDPLKLFQAFYEEVKGEAASEETEAIFKDVLEEFLREETEQKEGVKQ
jgi:exonuclease SbcD